MRPALKRTLILSSFPAILALLYAGFWFWSAQILEKTVLDEIALWRNRGYDIALFKSQKENFPLFPEISLQDLSFENSKEGWFGYIERVRIAAPFFGLTRTYRLQTGQAAITLADGKAMSVKAFSVEGNFPLQGTIPDQSAIMLSAEQIELPVPFGLSRVIDHLEVAGYLDKNLDLPFSAAQLRAWRDQGGALQIEAFALRQQALDLSGNVTFAFDQDMQILAAGIVTGKGIDQVIDQLARDDKLKLAAALLVKQIIKQAKGDNPTITAALSAQNNYLYLDAQRLVKLPPIRWPE